MTQEQAEQKPEQTTKKQAPLAVYQEFEERDEDQILAEMRGEMVKDLVYDITLQGHHVTNLSYAGVKEAIRRRGNLEILEIHTEETETEIRALVKVRDLQNRIDVLGASTADKTKPFYYPLALNKAERNAFAKLIPAKWFAALIEEYLTRKHGHEEQPEKPPAQRTSTENTTPALTDLQVCVPITKNPTKMEGLKQLALVDGLKSLGMINAFQGQVSIVPERPLKKDSAAISSFLIPRAIEPLCAKNSFTFRMAQNKNGELTYILIFGELTDTQLKELQAGVRWAFSKSLEKTETEQKAS